MTPLGLVPGSPVLVAPGPRLGGAMKVLLYLFICLLSALVSAALNQVSGAIYLWWKLGGWIDLEVLLVYGGAHFILFFVAALFTFWTVRDWGSLAPAGLSAFIFVVVILFFCFSFGDVGGLAVSILGFSSVVQGCCLVFLYRNTGLSK